MSSRRDALAQAAAVRLVAAACSGLGRKWDRQEQLHLDATTHEQAVRAARPLTAICASCPIVTECRAWAEVDQYTGIAAGSAWVKGVEKPTEWIHRHPMKKQAS